MNPSGLKFAVLFRKRRPSLEDIRFKSEFGFERGAAGRLLCVKLLSELLNPISSAEGCKYFVI